MLRPPELSGPLAGYVAVLALGLRLAAPFVIEALRRPGSHLAAAGLVFVATVASLLASWWLLWPAPFWLNGWLGRHGW